MKLFWLAPLLLIITSCALMDQISGTYWSKTDCETANWKEVGQNDGQSGLSLVGAREYYTSRCLERHNIAPDWSKHNEGHQLGLKTYCTYNGGLEAGARGEEYQGVCPRKLEVNFKKGYRLGSIQLHKQAILRADQEIIDLMQKQNRLSLELNSVRASSKNPSNDTKVRWLESDVQKAINRLADAQKNRLYHQQALVTLEAPVISE